MCKRHLPCRSCHVKFTALMNQRQLSAITRVLNLIFQKKTLIGEQMLLPLWHLWDFPHISGKHFDLSNFKNNCRDFLDWMNLYSFLSLFICWGNKFSPFNPKRGNKENFPYHWTFQLQNTIKKIFSQKTKQFSFDFLFLYIFWVALKLEKIYILLSSWIF